MKRNKPELKIERCNSETTSSGDTIDKEYKKLDTLRKDNYVKLDGRIETEYQFLENSSESIESISENLKSIETCIYEVDKTRRFYMFSIKDLQNQIKNDEKDVQTKLELLNNLQEHIDDLNKSISRNQVALCHLMAFYSS